jgi:A/G-specific adenine glycosylase
MPPASLQTRLLNWYRKNKRIFPWRDRADAYAVWVSEIMLQQTRTETVVPYFENWMRLFPSVAALARASDGEVLRAWEGLGYYSRARNLHKAAKIVLERCGGTLPEDATELIKLPGIGRYTAGAIASMAFGKDEPALDGNLKRVYARLFDLDEPVNTPGGERVLWDVARRNLPRGRAGDFNQALMDLGATICLPKKPRCSLCPVADLCAARRNGAETLRPVKKAGKPAPGFVHAAGVIVQRGRVLLAKRPSGGLLGGMWEFPNGRVEGDPAEELAKVLWAGYGLKVRRRDAAGVVCHAYTHFTVTVHVFLCDLSVKPRSDSLKWVRWADLDVHPMGKADRMVARTAETRVLSLNAR